MVEYKYKQIATEIANAIATGKLKGKIPGERILAREYQVNVLTANKAVSSLVDSGLLERRRGLGTFTVEDDIQRQLALGLVGYSIEETFFKNFYYTSVLEGVQDVIQKFNCVLSYQKKGAFSHKNLFMGGLLVSGMFIFNPALEHKRELIELRDSLTPFILIGDTPEEELNCVDSDNLNDTKRGVNFLLSQGHKRILFLLYTKKHSAPIWRWRGYREALKENGIPYDPKLVFCLEKEISKKDRESFQSIFSSSPKPTAVFSTGYKPLSLFLGCLSQTKFKPWIRKLEVMLYDDDYDALSYLGRPYFVIQQPMREIGRMAARELVKLIQSGNKNRLVQINFPSKVVRKEVDTVGRVLKIEEVG